MTPAATLPAVRRTGPAARGDGPRITLVTAGGRDEASLRSHARALPVPEGDVHVSRSYCHPFGVLASHVAPVGIDIERVEEDDPALLASIATPDEQALGVGAVGGVSSLWSSKEALAKALGDALAHDPRRLESPALWPSGRCGRWQARSLSLVDGYVVWVVWQAPAACET